MKKKKRVLAILKLSKRNTLIGKLPKDILLLICENVSQFIRVGDVFE